MFYFAKILWLSLFFHGNSFSFEACSEEVFDKKQELNLDSFLSKSLKDIQENGGCNPRKKEEEGLSEENLFKKRFNQFAVSVFSESQKSLNQKLSCLQSSQPNKECVELINSLQTQVSITYPLMITNLAIGFSSAPNPKLQNLEGGEYTSKMVLRPAKDVIKSEFHEEQVTHQFGLSSWRNIGINPDKLPSWIVKRPPVSISELSDSLNRYIVRARMNVVKKVVEELELSSIEQLSEYSDEAILSEIHECRYASEGLYSKHLSSCVESLDGRLNTLSSSDIKEQNSCSSLLKWLEHNNKESWLPLHEEESQGPLSSIEAHRCLFNNERIAYKLYQNIEEGFVKQRMLARRDYHILIAENPILAYLNLGKKKCDFDETLDCYQKPTKKQLEASLKKLLENNKETLERAKEGKLRFSTLMSLEPLMSIFLNEKNCAENLCEGAREWKRTQWRSDPITGASISVGVLAGVGCGAVTGFVSGPLAPVAGSLAGASCGTAVAGALVAKRSSELARSGLVFDHYNYAITNFSKLSQADQEVVLEVWIGTVGGVAGDAIFRGGGKLLGKLSPKGKSFFRGLVKRLGFDDIPSLSSLNRFTQQSLKTLKSKYPNLSKRALQKIVAAKKVSRSKPLQNVGFNRKAPGTEVYSPKTMSQTLKIFPEIDKPMKKAISLLSDTKRWDSYLEDISASVFNRMIKTNDPKQIALANKGIFSRSILLEEFAERFSKRNLKISVIPKEADGKLSFDKFRAYIFKGPILDDAFDYSLQPGNLHGPYPHLFQLDYVLDDMLSAAPRDFKAQNFFEIWGGSPDGLGLWNDSFDLYEEGLPASLRNFETVTESYIKQFGIDESL